MVIFSFYWWRNCAVLTYTSLIFREHFWKGSNWHNIKVKEKLETSIDRNERFIFEFENVLKPWLGCGVKTQFQTTLDLWFRFQLYLGTRDLSRTLVRFWFHPDLNSDTPKFYDSWICFQFHIPGWNWSQNYTKTVQALPRFPYLPSHYPQDCVDGKFLWFKFRLQLHCLKIPYSIVPPFLNCIALAPTHHKILIKFQIWLHQRTIYTPSSSLPKNFIFSHSDSKLRPGYIYTFRWRNFSY